MLRLQKGASLRPPRSHGIAQPPCPVHLGNGATQISSLAMQAKEKVGIRMSALPHWKLLGTAMMLSLIFGLSRFGRSWCLPGHFLQELEARWDQRGVWYLQCLHHTSPSSSSLSFCSEARGAALPISIPLNCCRGLPRHSSQLLLS